MNDRQPADESISELALDRIEAICEAFELELRRGGSPSVEVFLQRAPPADRPRLCDELNSLQRFYCRKSLSDSVAPQLRVETELDRRAASNGTRPDAVAATTPGALAPQPDDPDLQDLLRRRLWMLALMSAGGSSLELLRFATIAALGNGVLHGDAFRQYVASITLLIAVTSALAGLLARRHSMSVARLRQIELAIIVSVAGWGAWATYAFFREYLPQFAEAPERSGVLVMFLGHGLTLFWVTMIFAYGLMIPNAWPRTLRRILALAAAPLAAAAIVGWTEPRVTSGVVLHLLVSIALWLSVATPLSLYGAHRIESLRQKVLEGSRLGQYQLKRLLGRGGMGEVYLAEHALLRRPCAVKVIHTERAADRAALLRFEREAQATAALTSPHTVEIYDYGRTREGLFYYVMEYLPGVDLERLVRDHGPLPAERVLYLLDQLCSALQEAHNKGLVHRDIKPSNVILCERGGLHDSVKLLDFGLVRIAQVDDERGRLTQDGWIAGTPAYLSPEQAQGNVEVGPRSDIYSLGALAYFLLVGRPPFLHASAMRTMAAHIYESLVSPRTLCGSIPTDVEDAVLRCLAKIPSERFPDIASLRESLARCASAEQWTATRAREWWSAMRRGGSSK